MFVLIIKIVANLIIYAIVGSIVGPLVICLWRTYAAPKKSEPMRGRPLDPSLPSGAWVNVNHHRSAEDKRRQIVDRSANMAQLFARIVGQYSRNRCFGYRPLLAEDHAIQPDGHVLRKFTLNDYQWLTYEEVNSRIAGVAAGLRAIGVKRRDVVCIYADTRLEWMVTCQAVWRLGAVVATVYTNLGDDGVLHVVNQTEATHLVTSDEFLTKLAPIVDKMPTIKHIIHMNSGITDPLEVVSGLFTDTQRESIEFHSFQRIEQMGKELTEQSAESVATDESIGGDETALLMYTSGSTGVPKGVMISHKNLLFAVRAFYAFADALTPGEDIYAAFLPLAHCLEICAEISFLSVGVPVGYCSVHTLTDRSLGLQKGMKGDLTLLRPTVMAAVPLILDRIMKAITDEVDKRPLILRLVINAILKYKSFCAANGLNTPLINHFVCRKFAALMGGRLRFIASGGAPLRPETHRFICNLFNVKVLQGYGLTETTAAATIMTLDDESVGRVGPPMDGALIKIDLVDWTEVSDTVGESPVARGELLIGGGCVTNGYFKDPELTEQYFKVDDEVKWFRTGDIGELYANGTIRIVDRIKDIIKLSHGEYVSLSQVEEKLKLMPIVANVCVYGNSLNDGLNALIVPNRNHLEALARSVSKSSQMDIKQLCDDLEIIGKVLVELKEFCVNSGLTKVQIPTKIKLCAEEWLPDNGLVTSSFKLKRKALQEYYNNDIKPLFAS
ncbi:unnamed protein product [Medioppia subpectinata]|uniref:long-chain-fatty-acid--CoA ligase n=1 Tax=Medioppia subpectinata TaxID=1979941 RepID=A0A7R9KV90_9ACAR|nr:unnamed protein product [Medioppia subpectinata]CAG2109358.1 unnamed protein product [Medioppia subpectinata]